MISEKKFYEGTDLHVKFSCFEDDGTTPFDLGGGGRVEITLLRNGLKPFYLLTSTDDSSANVSWTNRSEGTGTMTVPIRDVVVPTGMMKFGLVAVASDGREEIQEISWITIRPGLLLAS